MHVTIVLRSKCGGPAMPRGHYSPAVLPGPWPLHSLLTLCVLVGGGRSTHPLVAEHPIVQFDFNHDEPKRKGTNKDNFSVGALILNTFMS